MLYSVVIYGNPSVEHLENAKAAGMDVKYSRSFKGFKSDE
jgi:hypothetical protein